METELLRTFRARLVPLIGECFQPITDQCLSYGLISNSTYKEMLYSSDSNENKARKLMLAVEASINSDKNSWDLFVSILEGHFPIVSRKALLKDLKEKLTEVRSLESGTNTIVPFSDHQYKASLTTEIAQQGQSIFSKLEEAILELERARTSRIQLEKEVESKTHEVEELRQKLEEQKAESDSQRDNTEHRIFDCESEISKLKEKMNELESIIEEQGMRVRRNKSFILLKTKQLVDFVRHGEEHHEEALQEKEVQLLQAKMNHETKLKEKEDELLQAKKEIEELRQTEEMNKLKHTVALQEKDLKIKDLELEVQSRPNHFSRIEADGGIDWK